MKRARSFLRVFGFAPLLLAVATHADAQCEFERSPKAKKLSVSLVRTMSACPSVHFPGPNSQVGPGIPACSPPHAPSDYSFGPRGSCEVSLSQKPGKACTDEPCSDFTVKARCADVLDAGAQPTDGEAGWKLQATVQIAQVDPDGNDDLYFVVPIEMAMPPSDSGRLSLTATMSELELRDVLGWPPLPLSNCASLALIGNTSYGASNSLGPAIIDPAGEVFASIGTATSGDVGPCAADLPARVKGVKAASLVRTFEVCSEYPPFQVGAPACEVPPVPSSTRRYDAKKGACNLKIGQRIQACESNPANLCGPLSVSLKCRGLLGADNTAVNESGWYLAMTVTPTLNDAGNDATMINIPMRFELPAIADGEVELEVLRTDFGDDGEEALEIPACVNFTFYDVALFDPTDAKFARLGTASFPK